jgi:hypothetical protein
LLVLLPRLRRVAAEVEGVAAAQSTSSGVALIEIYEVP